MLSNFRLTERKKTRGKEGRKNPFACPKSCTMNEASKTFVMSPLALAAEEEGPRARPTSTGRIGLSAVAAKDRTRTGRGPTSPTRRQPQSVPLSSPRD